MSMSKLVRALAAVTAIGLAMTTGAAHAESLYNMPVGVTPISELVYWLHMRTFWICVGLAVVVFGIMFISIIVHRKSRGAVAARFHENLLLELAWTIAPVIILIVMAVPAVGVLAKMYDTSHAKMTIKVTGYQWMWHYDYIGKNISFYSKLSESSNRARVLGSDISPYSVKNYLRSVDHPMVVPTGQKIRLLITSGDVIHSWWVPDFGGKMDAIPGYINHFWIKIDKPGRYSGQCAELCGRDHAFMPIVVIAKKPQAFRAWVKAHGGNVNKADDASGANQSDNAKVTSTATPAAHAFSSVANVHVTNS